MYSTISKDKIDKHVIDFIYKLFVLLVASIEGPHPTGHNLTGCRVKYLSLALAQRTLKKNDGAMARHMLNCRHWYAQTHTYSHRQMRVHTHAHALIIGHSSNQFHS